MCSFDALFGSTRKDQQSYKIFSFPAKWNFVPLMVIYGWVYRTKFQFPKNWSNVTHDLGYMKRQIVQMKPAFSLRAGRLV